MNEFPCPSCGSKKRFHKKGCKMSKPVEQISVPEPEQNPFMCCGSHMQRQGFQSRPHCFHGVPLARECHQCNVEQQGNVLWQCQTCGKEYREVPAPVDWGLTWRARGVEVEG